MAQMPAPSTPTDNLLISALPEEVRRLLVSVGQQVSLDLRQVVGVQHEPISAVPEEHAEESPDRLIRRLLNLASHPANGCSPNREALFMVARVSA